MSEDAPHLAAYGATLEWLLSLEAKRGMDFKLERVQRALDALGNPHRSFRAIHVAGTNGKGSTAAMAESILRRAGRRTGLYTSPHLVDFRERVRVVGSWISRERVVDLIDTIRRVARPEEHGLTFFEVGTILAFLHFAAEDVDIAVVEVGLGGRLDATNVLDADVAAITSIGFDHEQFLGSSLAAIAAEKAGILKPGRAAVIGPLAADARSVVESVAQRVGAHLHVHGRDFSATAAPRFSFRSSRRVIAGVQLPLLGRHQVDNAAIAIAAVDALESTAPLPDTVVRSGLESARWPGRLEIVADAPSVVLDAAHNEDGARTLADALQHAFPSRRAHLVFGVMADKQWRAMVDHLLPRVASVTVTSVPMQRAEDPAVIARLTSDRVPTHVCPDPRQAVETAVARAAPEDLVIVAGSIFLIGAVRPLFATDGDDEA